MTSFGKKSLLKALIAELENEILELEDKGRDASEQTFLLRVFRKDLAVLNGEIPVNRPVRVH